MKTFKQKDYLKNKITPENCGHELLSTSCFDDGIYGTTYNCLICGKQIHYGIYDYHDIDNKYVYKDLTENNIDLIKKMITYISKRHVYDEYIDIISNFEEISPYLEKIFKYLNAYDIEKAEKEKDNNQKVIKKKKDL